MARDRSRSRDRSGRKRSRSRSRERRRSRSRDRRDKWAEPDPNSAVAQMQALAAAQAQAQLQRQMLAQQQALLGGTVAAPALPNTSALVAAAAAAAGGATIVTAGAPVVDATAARKSREIYIGNLAAGCVTMEMLQELFNAALAGMVPDPVGAPPVLAVKMDPTGACRFAFVEFRNEELATTAMSLDRTELMGRAMNIGRPKGYVPGSGSAAAATNDTLAAAQQVAATLLGGLTPVVLLEGLLDAATIRSSEERQEVSEMVYEEALRCGKVLGIAVPLPPSEVADDTSCRVYIKYGSSSDAAKCKEMMDGRLFDDNKVKATHVTEVDYARAAAGEWIGVGAGPGLPGPAAAPPQAMPTGLGAAPTFIPGLSQAPLAIPALLPTAGIPGLGLAGMPPVGFPPPPP